jgi:hypothetical protein
MLLYSALNEARCCPKDICADKRIQMDKSSLYFMMLFLIFANPKEYTRDFRGILFQWTNLPVLAAALLTLLLMKFLLPNKS